MLVVRCAAGTGPLGRYLAELPPFEAFRVRRRELIGRLDDTEKIHYRHLLKRQAKEMALLQYQLQRNSIHIPDEALLWAHHVVRSRAIELPSRCAPSAPHTLDALLDSSKQLMILPAIVPIVDLVNNCRIGEENCALYTCEDASKRQERSVIMCTTREVLKGEELQIRYAQLDRPTFLFRFGFLL